MDKVSNNDLKSIALDMPKRNAMDIDDAKDFVDFYGVDDSSLTKYKNNIFWYPPIEDEIYLKRVIGANAFPNEEVYRRGLRDTLSKHLGHWEKLRNFELTSKLVDPNNPNEFIKEKGYRFFKFSQILVQFVLSLLHSLYWEDDKGLKPSALSMRECLNKVIPFAQEITRIYEKELNEEFNTDDIDKITNVDDKSKSKPPKKKKSKKPKE